MSNRVLPPAEILLLPFVFGDGAAAIVPPLVRVMPVQGTPLRTPDPVIYRLVGWIFVQDPAAALTGVTVTMQYADGVGALSPFVAVTGTLPFIAVGTRGNESYSPNLVTATAPPLPEVNDNCTFAVTLATAPANAVSVTLSLVLERVG